MRIISLNIGKPKLILCKEKEFVSGISKKSIQKARLNSNCFDDDDVANLNFHGGPDRAVCFYPYEHYQLWENESGLKLSIPAFGENLTVSGMLEKNVCIGDIYQIGEAVIQITQGRIPCSTISKFNSNNELLKKLIETCYTGYFARVLKEGMINAESEIVLIDRHPLKISVFETMNTLFHQNNNIESIRKILQIEELALVMKEKFNNKLMIYEKGF
ncbi:MOSC domain-containing protein [Heyndrickxia sporothermodurans]